MGWLLGGGGDPYGGETTTTTTEDPDALEEPVEPRIVCGRCFEPLVPGVDRCPKCLREVKWPEPQEGSAGV